MIRRLAVIAMLFAAEGAANAQDARSPLDTEASHLVIMDYETGMMLYDIDGEAPMPPASMSKLMTVLMAFEAIERGSLSLEDELPVSEYAWRTGGAATGGSTMFLEVNSRARVIDLLRGVIVQSGNDACIVLAEAISGSEARFAEDMTERARELGLDSATFRNATGLPDPEHRISARDLAEIARIIIRDHRDLYELFAETDFTWNGIRQYNRNPLLGVFSGADGLKTGHTEESGYGLVASAERDGVRRIVVFNGTDSIGERASEAERLMRAAFSDFRVATLYEAGDYVIDIPVALGEAETVGAAVADEITFGYHRRAARDLHVEAVFEGPLSAPVAAGDVVGALIVELPGAPSRTVDLVATDDVARAGMFARAQAALVHLIRESGASAEDDGA